MVLCRRLFFLFMKRNRRYVLPTNNEVLSLLNAHSHRLSWACRSVIKATPTQVYTPSFLRPLGTGQSSSWICLHDYRSQPEAGAPKAARKGTGDKPGNFTRACNAWMSSKLDTVLLNGCATYSGDQSTVTHYQPFFGATEPDFEHWRQRDKSAYRTFIYV